MSRQTITLLYYTANRIEERFGDNIRKHLLSFDLPIISVSHKPMDFGYNIVCDDMEPSVYNIYRQILYGVVLVETEYVACCEDDALYTLEHFSYRPAKDTFAYSYRWLVNKDCYFFRHRANMCMCIAPTKLLIETLLARFIKYPPIVPGVGMTPDQLNGFGEPGRYEWKLGLPTVKMEVFNQTIPTLTFNHRPSMGGVRVRSQHEQMETELPNWGKASDLWKRFYDGEGNS